MRRLMWFFAIVYVVEGVGQTGGLIAQPLNYYLKQVYGWTPVQVTASLTVLNLPWVIKPVYGLVSDFLPLFGSRRRAYLILANLAGAAAYLWVTQLSSPPRLIFALLLTAYAMAVSSTLCGAVLVENGQRLRASDAFVNQQWLWFNIAAMASSIVGGQLVAQLPAAAAVHWAAAIIAVAPLLVVFGTTTLIAEPRTAVNLTEFKRTLSGLFATFAERDLWLIAGFLFLYYLNPGIGTPLYYQMTDVLKFSQAYIGILGAVASGGWIAGALIYRLWLKGLTAKALLNLSILLGTATTAAYLLLSGPVSAAMIYVGSGIAGMIAFVATLSLAADFCPRRAEGFAFAALMSITNLSSALSDNLGSLLYEHVFGSRLAPLIVVSAAATAVAFVLVPFLRLEQKRPGEPGRGLTSPEPSL